MEFESEEESLKRYGEPSALNKDEIKNIIKLSRPTKKDTFCDLGSGYGDVVRYIYSNTNVKRAVGLEMDILRFLVSVEKTRTEFKRKYLKKIDFWCADYRNYDISDATIIYDGVDEISDHPSLDNDSVKLYRKYFKKKKIKIIKRDFPLVGYLSVKAIRDRKNSWFFLMKTPLDEYKIDSQEEWIEHVFNQKNKTVIDLAKYDLKAYKKRSVGLPKSGISQFTKNFKRIAKKRFES